MNDIEFIKENGLIAILRGITLEKIDKIIEALYSGGVKIIEIAFDPSDNDTVFKTSNLIKRACEVSGGKVMIGAGTGICREYVVAAYNSGARFIFSPDTDADVIKLTKELGMVSIPGAFTPSEYKTAYKNGADIIKLFPVTVDEINYIKNIARPLSYIPFICVGGINESTVKPFILAGACGVGTGISILKPNLIENDDYAEITRLARLHADAVKNAKMMSK